MTTIAATDFQVAPCTADDAVSLRRTRPTHRSPFSEVREARQQHMLQVGAVSTGILSVTVTVAASAAIVLTLSA